jgi:hypothetical protein
MPTSKKNDQTERLGGPGSSHQNQQEPEKTKPRGGHPVDKQSSDFAGKSTGGGEPDAHHTHDPRGKGPSHQPGR